MTPEQRSRLEIDCQLLHEGGAGETVRRNLQKENRLGSPCLPTKMPMAIPLPILPITPEVAAAYSLCKRKAFLLLRGDAGESPHEYVRLLEAHAATSRHAFLTSLQATGLTVQQC